MLWGEIDTGAPSGNVVAFVTGQLGVVGALVWYLWHQTSREMPAARRDFLAAIQAQREAHHQDTRDTREDMRRLTEELHQLTLALQDMALGVDEQCGLRRGRKFIRQELPQSSPGHTGRDPA